MKLKKVFSIVTIAIMLIASLSNVALATEINIMGVINTTGSTSTNAALKVNSLGSNILGIVQTVGTIAAIVTLIILGIKYMMGSAEEKAEYKKTLMPYVIGAVLVLAASNIVKWVFDAAGNFFN